MMRTVNQRPSRGNRFFRSRQRPQHLSRILGQFYCAAGQHLVQTVQAGFALERGAILKPERCGLASWSPCRFRAGLRALLQVLC